MQWQPRLCLQGRGLICNHIAFDADSYVFRLPMAPIEAEIENWSVFKTILFHWSCNIETVSISKELCILAKNWLAHEE